MARRYRKRCVFPRAVSSNAVQHNRSAAAAGDETAEGELRHLMVRIALRINDNGAIVGFYADSAGSIHGFLRASNGTISKLNVPGAGTADQEGTASYAINNDGVIAGVYANASRVSGGFIRTP